MSKSPLLNLKFFTCVPVPNTLELPNPLLKLSRYCIKSTTPGTPVVNALTLCPFLKLLALGSCPVGYSTVGAFVPTKSTWTPG